VESHGVVQFGSTLKVSSSKAYQMNLTVLQKFAWGEGEFCCIFYKKIKKLFLHFIDWCESKYT